MTIELKIAGESDSDEWDGLLERSSHGTIFHSWKWLKIAEKHTNSKLYPIIGYKGTTPIGIFPLFYQRKIFLKMVLSPPLHTAMPYLGPVLVGYDKLRQGKKETTFVDFQKQVDEFISKELDANYINISLPPGLCDPRPFRWSGYHVETGYGYVKNIYGGFDYMKGQFGKKFRLVVTRATKEGLLVEESNREGLEAIYNLLVDRYAEQDRVVKVPKSYLLAIYDSFSDNFKIFVAKYRGEIVSGQIDAYYKDRASSWIGNPRPSVKMPFSPNDLLNWEAVRYACEHGLKYYETIGTAGDKRLHMFYSKSNPDLLVHFLVKKYSPSFVRWMEMSYTKMLRPLLKL